MKKKVNKFDNIPVLFLRDLLDARMRHCKIERDARVMQPDGETQKFNPDSYVAMKFLMLDIREWLIGEVVKFDPTGDE